LQDSLKNNAISGGDLPEILNDLALARARQGKAAPAIEELKRATELDPDEDDYPFNLGLIYLDAKDAASAEKYFREASDREPDNPENRALLIYALQKEGKKEEAEDEKSTVAEALGPDALPQVKPDSLAKLQRTTDELDITALQMEIVSAQSNTNPSSTNGTDVAPSAYSLARSARNELVAGHVDAAESGYRAALKAQPDYAPAHRGLAEVLRRQGKLDEAATELQDALARRDSAVDRTTLARIYLEQKNVAEAKVQLQRALKLAPNYAEAKQMLDHLPGGNSGKNSP
jgi:tetratricopeptide (TPR) repeat protein